MANKDWCRHYNGIPNKTCKAGMSYDAVRDTSSKPARWPCINADAVTACPWFEHYTDEEIEKTDRAVSQFLEGIEALSSGKSDVCPHCGKQITSMRQVRRCVYASCGCRLWQGTIPQRWRNSAR